MARRDNYRRAFDHFEIIRVAAYDDSDIERLMGDVGIIRSRRKIGSVIGARAVHMIQQEFGSSMFIYGNVSTGRTLQHRYKSLKDVPSRTTDSEAMSKDLLRRGFRL